MVVKRKMWKSFEIKLFSEPFSDWGKPGKSSFNILICNISVSIFPFSSKKTFGKQTKELSWLILFETISKAKEKKKNCWSVKKQKLFQYSFGSLKKKPFSLKPAQASSSWKGRKTTKLSFFSIASKRPESFFSRETLWSGFKGRRSLCCNN